MSKKKINMLSDEKINIKYSINISKNDLKSLGKANVKVMRKNIPSRTGNSKKKIRYLLKDNSKTSSVNSTIYVYMKGNGDKAVSPLAHLLENGHKTRLGIQNKKKSKNKNYKYKEKSNGKTNVKGSHFTEKTIDQTKTSFIKMAQSKTIIEQQ